MRDEQFRVLCRLLGGLSLKDRQRLVAYLADLERAQTWVADAEKRGREKRRYRPRPQSAKRPPKPPPPRPHWDGFSEVVSLQNRVADDLYAAAPRVFIGRGYGMKARVHYPLSRKAYFVRQAMLRWCDESCFVKLPNHLRGDYP